MHNLRICIVLSYGFLQRIFKERGWCQFEEPTPVLALSDSAHVPDYESPDGSTVEDSNDDCNIYLSSM